jgi:hypothetical protein
VVADAQTSYGDEEAAAIGPSFEGFESGHALAGTGDMLVVLGGSCAACEPPSASSRSWRSSTMRPTQAEDDDEAVDD